MLAPSIERVRIILHYLLYTARQWIVPRSGRSGLRARSFGAPYSATITDMIGTFGNMVGNVKSRVEMPPCLT